MAKPIEIDGILYRKRRGRLVKIPDEWVGRTVGSRTIRRRHSKTRAKAIYGKVNRAKDKAAMRRGEEPHPKSRKTIGCWHPFSGRTDRYRNKYRTQRSRNTKRRDDHQGDAGDVGQ